ncbi:hypothetical protein CSPAE12_05951 [Colletotrichum incanum]|nr:hypothetical protein CSPAE12_05951 [Colletotrichum incanum]
MKNANITHQRFQTSCPRLVSRRKVIDAIDLSIEETERSQIGLVEASKQCVNTKRFMPSQYDPINTPEFFSQKIIFRLANQAVILGSAEVVVSVTYSIDLAQFIAWALEVKDWSRFSIVIGTDLTPNEALAKIERVRGKNFEFAYDSEEALSQNKATSLGSPRAMIYEPVEEYSMIG